jgi:hypothetical protein
MDIGIAGYLDWISLGNLLWQKCFGGYLEDLVILSNKLLTTASLFQETLVQMMEM